jgi:hypothetical protein
MKNGRRSALRNRKTGGKPDGHDKSCKTIHANIPLFSYERF